MSVTLASASELTQFNAVTMELAGADPTLGWDGAVFAQLKAYAAKVTEVAHTLPSVGTHTTHATGLTSDEAEALWTYTDGYKATVKTTSKVTFAGATAQRTVFCFQKTVAGAATTVNATKNASDGSLCWAFDAGRLLNVGYHKTITHASITQFGNAATTGGWDNAKSPTATNMWAGGYTVDAPNGDVYCASGQTQCHVLAMLKPAKADRYAKMTAVTTALEFMWYMPKHQQHDYYQYNFRLNKGDTVKLCVAEQKTAADTITWVHPAAQVLATGAGALAATAAIAAGAAFLAF